MTIGIGVVSKMQPPLPVLYSNKLEERLQKVKSSGRQLFRIFLIFLVDIVFILRTPQERV